MDEMARFVEVALVAMVLVPKKLVEVALVRMELVEARFVDVALVVVPFNTVSASMVEDAWTMMPRVVVGRSAPEMIDQSLNESVR